MLLACALPCAATAASVTAIVGATLIHPELEGAAAVARDNTIVISGNRITSVGPTARVQIPRDAPWMKSSLRLRARAIFSTARRCSSCRATGYALSGLWQPTEAEQRLADPEVLARLHLPEGTPADKLPERMRKRLAEQRAPDPPQVAMQNLLTIWNAGITVVMGTDAGNIGTVHGPSVFREMDLMQRSGLTSAQVLRSATVNGALTMGAAELGTIAPGKLADLLVLDADPLADLANLSRASYVFRDGRVFRPADLMRSLREPAGS